MSPRLVATLFVIGALLSASQALDVADFLENAKYEEQVISMDESVTVTNIAGLNLTLPGALQQNIDVQGLYDQALSLAERSENLLNFTNTLIENFSNATSPQLQGLQVLRDRLQNVVENATDAFNFVAQIEEQHNQNQATLSNIGYSLQCFQAATSCGPQPPANFNCTNAVLQSTTGPGQSGSLVFNTLTSFNSCDFYVNAAVNGLAFNVTVSNFGSQTGGSLSILDSGHPETNVILNSSSPLTNSFTNLKGTLDISANGALKFTLSFVSYSICANYDCGNGSCVADGNNNPTCVCNACYSLNSTSGICDVPYKPCTVYGRLCTGGGGTCETNTTSCTYYCKCPGNVTQNFCIASWKDLEPQTALSWLSSFVV